MNKPQYGAWETFRLLYLQHSEHKLAHFFPPVALSLSNILKISFKTIYCRHKSILEPHIYIYDHHKTMPCLAHKILAGFFHCLVDLGLCSGEPSNGKTLQNVMKARLPPEEEMFCKAADQIAMICHNATTDISLSFEEYKIDGKQSGEI